MHGLSSNRPIAAASTPGMVSHWSEWSFRTCSMERCGIEPPFPLPTKTTSTLAAYLCPRSAISYQRLLIYCYSWPSIVTSKSSSTKPIGLAIVLRPPPAKSKPTGLFESCVTTSEPESPPRLNRPFVPTTTI